MHRGVVMNKKLIILAFGSESWIGGIYYKKNILFQLLQNENIVSAVDIVVMTSPELKHVFEDVPGNFQIIALDEKEVFGNKVRSSLFFIKNRGNYIFPCTNFRAAWFGVKGIFWIPDFQHHHCPQYFQQNDINNRIKFEKNVEKSKLSLVVSSRDALSDCNSLYKKQNIFVVPFVSFIEPTLRKMTRNYECFVLNKYGLTGKKYACLMNQFWQHKNHIVFFKALEIYFSNGESDFEFVLTGKMEDYRSPQYIEMIKKIYEDERIKKCVKLLGFIDREEQLALMKNAEYIIQPSLFEGWGTVVEDAKVLDKTILLSDIPIHREQKNNKCILFNPHDPNELARLIVKENNKKHVSDLEYGIDDMRNRAKEYSKGFQALLGC